MEKMRVLIAFLVNLSIFISFPLSAQSSLKNKGKSASLVNVNKVQYFDLAEKTESIGILVAINPTIISSKISQEILKISSYEQREKLKEKLLQHKMLKIMFLFLMNIQISNKKLVLTFNH